jgi:hypothetical protein
MKYVENRRSREGGNHVTGKTASLLRQAWMVLSLRSLSRDQTYRKKLFPFRVSIERGLEYYAWHLYRDRNFLGAFHRKRIATFDIMTNPPSCDDDNELNFHLLNI